jgi:hypothetical protein
LANFPYSCRSKVPNAKRLRNPQARLIYTSKYRLSGTLLSEKHNLTYFLGDFLYIDVGQAISPLGHKEYPMW